MEEGGSIFKEINTMEVFRRQLIDELHVDPSIAQILLLGYMLDPTAANEQTVKDMIKQYRKDRDTK